jgi:hypothetical protein
VIADSFSFWFKVKFICLLFSPLLTLTIVELLGRIPHYWARRRVLKPRS